MKNTYYNIIARLIKKMADYSQGVLLKALGISHLVNLQVYSLDTNKKYIFKGEKS